ncbi:fused signal recognition particle receptor [Mycoplasmoides fastidiosum]|uniref:Signal recognition particle receptor FtsY n=1 Tax=Mycoplasmoides fastidiosum TaxID=92758 RepID=A0ABU0LZN6_9BACT|nr:signal recognition particle-docking protein FtsY [Mycoplasmoides fastidiosum]MDQ0514063.1 fused signal recognition particle receptor [Mycoplasmoides fastidiosum]UUD37526.1 signal recognition particle-docking protein FtsY [Mycoplasmoides fastidiosum]
MAGFFKRIINKLTKKPNLEKELIQQNQAKADKVLVNVASQEKFNESLKKSATAFSQLVDQVAKDFKQVDDNFVQDLEDVLISFDIGPVTATKITEAIVDEIKYHNVKDVKLIKEIIVDKIFVSYIQDSILDTGLNIRPNQTNVILVMGANGVGKTTTIAKLANMLVKQNKKVLLVAGDTFRAGAIEQLMIWAKRLKINIVTPQKYGQDPVSVVFQGLTKAKDQHYDVVICDTSGRLQNKQNLMKELEKLYRVIKKFDPSAPHETLLVLDALVGQSGLYQAEAFNEAAQITGIILTKMDSTSKGGIIFAIKEAFNIPVKYIGLGESLDDLSSFDLERVVDSITDKLNL